ncbi:hypothetical protein [Paraburkholderia sp. SIMBA_054]|uniref:hypothetical protein n=1 Tax=Paraburkholderia sp. SIMBA_054 TaxID=3085795 RepID=UPI00397B6FA8
MDGALLTCEMHKLISLLMQIGIGVMPECGGKCMAILAKRVGGDKRFEGAYQKFFRGKVRRAVSGVPSAE